MSERSSERYSRSDRADQLFVTLSLLNMIRHLAAFSSVLAGPGGRRESNSCNLAGKGHRFSQSAQSSASGLLRALPIANIVSFI